jgi:hypothetical protein
VVAVSGSSPKGWPRQQNGATILQAIQQIGDRLDGKPSQAIERGDIPLEAMTDQQLLAIIRGVSYEPPRETAQIYGPPSATT